MPQPPKPKFKYGQTVQHRDDKTRVGIVSFIGSYDDLFNGYRYKVLELNGRRQNWNEPNMILVKGKK